MDVKARGTREEVWAGTARMTSGKLTKDDLMLSKRGKIVSKKQSEVAARRYPALKARLCGETKECACHAAEPGAAAEPVNAEPELYTDPRATRDKPEWLRMMYSLQRDDAIKAFKALTKDRQDLIMSMSRYQHPWVPYITPAQQAEEEERQKRRDAEIFRRRAEKQKLRADAEAAAPRPAPAAPPAPAANAEDDVSTVKRFEHYNEDNHVVYFGAGWDSSFLSVDYLKTFRNFVCIDALPKLAHYELGQSGYEKSKDEESFVRAIMDSYRRYKPKIVAHRGNLYVIDLTSGRGRVWYYINTTLEEALADPTIRKEINTAAYVYVKGWHPFSNGLKLSDVPYVYKNREEMVNDRKSYSRY